MDAANPTAWLAAEQWAPSPREWTRRSVSYRATADDEGRRIGFALLAILGLQVGLGIINVLGQLPLPVAVAHNGGAALLLLALVSLVHVLTPGRTPAAHPAGGR
jgi:heme A synthase